MLSLLLLLTTVYGLQTPPAVPGGKWIKLFSRGTYGVFDIGEAKFNEYLSGAKDCSHYGYGTVVRFCDDCSSSVHRKIYYQRISPIPTSKSPTMYKTFLLQWFNNQNNLNTDFKLYSNINDLKSQSNPWKFCNYNDNGVGFPRDCSPTQFTGGQWNSLSGSGVKNYAYYVLVKDTCDTLPSVPGSTWKKLYSRGTYGTYDIGENRFNELVEGTCARNGKPVVVRICDDCRQTHKAIFYQRLTKIPDNKNPTMYKTFTSDWFSSDNVLGKDFNLFSNYDDLSKNANGWKFCNYNDGGVGSFRDCGPTGYVPHEWVSKNRGGKKNYVFYALVSDSCAALPEVAGSSWVRLYSKGNIFGNFDIGRDTWNHYINQDCAVNKKPVVFRYCQNCRDSHKSIFYQRLTEVKTADMYSTFTSDWFSKDNSKGVDFNLYSNYDDLSKGVNKWSFCNYNDRGVGSFRDCGPRGYVPFQWNSKTRGGQSDVEFYGLVSDECLALPPVSNGAKWVKVYSKGKFGNTDIGASLFNGMLSHTCATEHKPVIVRMCDDCYNSHKVIFYQRLTDIPKNKKPDMYSTFLTDWFSSDNVINKDFKLFSTFDDLKGNKNQWTFCNYNDRGVGAFRDCGPRGYVPHQWNSKRRGGRQHIAYYILINNACASLPFIPGTKWVKAYSKGTYGTYDIGSSDFNAYLQQPGCRSLNYGVVGRLCSNCVPTHQKIFYKRISPIPQRKNPDMYTTFTEHWFSSNNVLNRDFKLYGNGDDLKGDKNPWRYCNYNDRGVGAFRDCGPDKYYGGQWNSKNRGGQPNVEYFILVKSDCDIQGCKYDMEQYVKTCQPDQFIQYKNKDIYVEKALQSSSNFINMVNEKNIKIFGIQLNQTTIISIFSILVVSLLANVALIISLILKNANKIKKQKYSTVGSDSEFSSEASADEDNQLIN